MAGCCQPGRWADMCMKKWGVQQQPRRIVMHYLTLLGEQLSAMLPLSLLQVAVLALFFHKAADNPGVAAAGLLSAVLGLVLLLDGLRLSVMPMAMQVGQHLPEKLPISLVMVVAFALGVLVTYAEPAIAAIRPLAALVDPQSAPYLYYVLNQQQEITVLSIGLGVGLAAVLGMLKFLFNLNLKLLIAGSLLPTIAAACWMQWGNPHLQPILGVAWDCGAVTTGPVTVPILLALGVSVMQAQRQKQQALAALEEAAVHRSEGNTLEGFGIVTLASLLPILAVEVMAIITSLIHPYDSVLREVAEAAKHADIQEEPLVNRSPIREVIFAVRAITPLCTALLLLLLCVLRVPLPVSQFDSRPETAGEDESSDDLPQQQQQLLPQTEQPAADDSPRSGVAVADLQRVVVLRAAGAATAAADATVTLQDAGAHKHQGLASPAEAAKSAACSGSCQTPKPSCHSRPEVFIDATQQGDGTGGAAEAVGAPALLSPASMQPGQTNRVWHGTGGPECDCAGAWWQRVPCSSRVSSRRSRMAAWLHEHAALLWGMLMCQGGMILFNLGLTYGFTALGDLTGTWLPTAFLKLPYAPGSPYYSVAGGVALTMVTVFLLGVLATNAEPALNVLGHTVEELSGGRFSKRLLVWAVSVGVAVGMDTGACKILFSLPLIYFILAKYAAASVLTVMTQEAYAAVAWDSAGVTTGPVTVPFVLAIGLAFGKAVGAPEGFGMLTVMSVAPIISVLVTSLLREPVVQATTGLVRVSSNLAKYSLERFSRRTASGSPHCSRSALSRNGDQTLNRSCSASPRSE